MQSLTSAMKSRDLIPLSGLSLHLIFILFLKRKNLSLRNRAVCNLSGFARVSFCKIAFYPRTVKRIVTTLMSSFLFDCFSLFLPHLRTRSENCFHFATSWPSLCLSHLLTPSASTIEILSTLTQPPGHLNFWKIFVQISPSPGRKAVQMTPPPGKLPDYCM